MMPDLGQLEKVDPRSVWQNEARDFTPWLAEENLDLLEDTIGIDLDLEGTEKSVGDFDADILCKDTVEDQWVLIENQLARTDHKHLGQLLTYAAGLGAVTVVWISDRFNDQHRSALDWLNEITVEDVNFFGLEIELWQIGDSPPAPKFNVVSKPNDWSETVSSAAGSEEVSDLKKLQREYWTKLKDHLEQNGSRVRPRTPKPRHWASYAVGRSKCRLTARVNTRDNLVGVQLLLTDEVEAEPLFHLLKEDRKAIEEEIGEPLDWQPKPDKKRFVIGLKWSADPTNKDKWPDQHQRLANVLEGFHKAFAPRLERLEPASWTPDQSVKESGMQENMVGGESP